MDISKWPIEKILQLPDSCFGRKWLIGVAGTANSGGVSWDICDLAFPDRAVIWGVFIQSHQDHFNVLDFRLALGDRKPTTTAQMDSLEALLPSVGLPGREPKDILYDHALAFMFLDMKFPVLPQGRRLVFELSAQAIGIATVMCNVLISSIPTEIPDFYAGSPMEQWEELIRLMRIGVKIR